MTYPPYRFNRVNVEHALSDAPVWHDGSDAAELWSGEILCSLEARTPLLPGNYRYEVKDATGWKSWNGVALDGEKQIAEPLRLVDGRILIAGSSIKGMLRNSLADLVAAPMERVAEHHYTYRPNLGHAKDGAARLECRPAVVVGIAPDRVEIKVLPHPRSAVFLQGETERKLSNGRRPGDTLVGPFNDVDFGVWRRDRRGNDVFSSDPARLTERRGCSVDLNHVLFAYKGGIDGQGLLAAAFKKGGRVHRVALVAADELDTARPKVVSAEVFARYQATQTVLGSREHGHLSRSHPLSGKFDPGQIKAAIEAAAVFEVNELIYVEVEVEATGELGEILSLGHHYQYRWAYTSSVRRRGGQVRRELRPLEAEAEGPRPQSLSAIRLLFGYVSGKNATIGEGTFERLAGRIAINHAVSQGASRFIDGEKGAGVALRPMGEPRASAVEFYLRPKEGQPPATYGDQVGDEGGDLAGRKFYLHQPSANQPSASQFKAVRNDREPSDCEVRSKHGVLARWVCAEGTKFKFAIRFARLRPWELGALLAVLEPHRMTENGKPGRYAHKLGLGRPLGLGSVMIRIDGLSVRREAEVTLERASDKLFDEAIQALRDKLVSAGLAPDHAGRWLERHEFLERGPFDYPRLNGKIFEWHTQLRRNYASLRRSSDADWEKFEREFKLQQASALPPRKT